MNNSVKATEGRDTLCCTVAVTQMQSSPVRCLVSSFRALPVLFVMQMLSRQMGGEPPLVLGNGDTRDK